MPPASLCNPRQPSPPPSPTFSARRVLTRIPSRPCNNSSGSKVIDPTALSDRDCVHRTSRSALALLGAPPIQHISPFGYSGWRTAHSRALLSPHPSAHLFRERFTFIDKML